MGWRCLFSLESERKKSAYELGEVDLQIGLILPLDDHSKIGSPVFKSISIFSISQEQLGGR
jgi:hypothetical protein